MVKRVSFYGPGQGTLGGEDPRRLMAQQLMAQGSMTTPIQAHSQGLDRVAKSALGAYMATAAQEEAKAKEGAGRAEMLKMLSGYSAQGGAPARDAVLNAPMDVDEMSTDVDRDAQAAFAQTGGMAGALSAIPGGPQTPAGQNMQMSLMMQDAEQRRAVELAEVSRRNKLSDAMALKSAPGGPNSPTGRPASGIQYKHEYDRIKDTQGLAAAESFLQQYVNQPWMDTGDKFIPRASPGSKGVKKELKPGEQPDVKRAQAKASIVGKGQGEVFESLAGAEAALPRLETAVKELKEIGKTATYTYAGQARDMVVRQTGFGATEGAKGRAKYLAHVKNNVLPLLRLTFGPAFTVAEGDSLLATLGEPDMSPGEKNAVLDAFISDKKSDIETLKRRTGKPAPAAPPVGADEEAKSALKQKYNLE